MSVTALTQWRRALRATQSATGAYDQGMKSTEQILESIDGRLRELNAEIETLDAARSALHGREAQQSRADGAAAASPARKSARTTTGKSARRRSRRNGKPSGPVEVVPAGRLEGLLSDDNGLTTSALAERSGGNRDQVLTLLRELEAAGRIRRTGQRRGTRWHAITDEDRIRERAAELAGRRRKSA